ncbi:MAG: hypothetical protein R3C28_07125 [Pirellulaceae bacterium]
MGFPLAAMTTDVDGDSDADIVIIDHAGPLIVTLRSQLTGDIDDNSVIDNMDIALVFAAIAAGEQDSLFDLNRDGDVDRRDADFLLITLLKTSAGDANLDGTFSSADLVLAFQAGLYEQADVVTAGWAEGDWNGDGLFDSSDLVLAFQTGHYVAAAL